MPNNCLKSSLLNFNPTAALLSLVHLDGSYIEFSNLFVHMFINIMTCFVFFVFPRGGQCAHIISISNSFHSQRPTSFPGPQWIPHNLSLGTSHVYKTKLLGSPLTLQFSSVTQLCLFVAPWTAACQASLSITNSQSLLKTHVHHISDAIQPSHPLPPPSPPAFNLSQHQGLFQ